MQEVRAADEQALKEAENVKKEFAELKAQQQSQIEEFANRQKKFEEEFFEKMEKTDKLTSR